MVVFIYYSGHGEIDKGDTHIIPTTPNQEDGDQPINIDGYLRQYTRNQNTVVVAIIDACRKDIQENQKPQDNDIPTS